jgi:hypothetical protein
MGISMILGTTECNWGFRRVLKIAKNEHEIRHVYLFVRMVQLGSRWTHIYKI